MSSDGHVLPRGFSHVSSEARQWAEWVSDHIEAVRLLRAGGLGSDEVSRLDDELRALSSPQSIQQVIEFWTPILREGRWRDLEADWRRTAVAFGTDSYETGRLVDVQWRAGDADAARVAIAQMRHALATQPFTAHGDDFHRGKNIEILDGFEALLAFDAGACAADDARLANLHPFVVASIYDVMWDAHAAGEQARACALGLLFIQTTGSLGQESDAVRNVMQSILSTAPSGSTAES